MTKRLVGAVGTSSAACPRRGGRVLCVHGDGSVHAPSRHLTPISTAVTTTQKGTCKMVGSPFHVAATSGEQTYVPVGGEAEVGSSPRVRGTGLVRSDAFHLHRFIPARAGNSHLVSSLPDRCSVHPRACGEQKQKPFSGGTEIGSSPRVRGTELDRFVLSSLRRFIPARAGNSCCG